MDIDTHRVTLMWEHGEKMTIYLQAKASRGTSPADILI